MLYTSAGFSLFGIKDPAFQQTLMADLVGWNPDVPQGGVVWVFAVR